MKKFVRILVCIALVLYILVIKAYYPPDCSQTVSILKYST